MPESNSIQSGENLSAGFSELKNKKSKVHHSIDQGNPLESHNWATRKGLKAAVSETLKTFKVDSIVRGSELPDLVKKSGNQILEGGFINNVQLGEDTGNKEIKGNPFVNNNNMLVVWKQGYKSEPRAIVMDYSKNPKELYSEKMLSTQNPTQGIDMKT